jgi:hypothetical protein
MSETNLHIYHLLPASVLTRYGIQWRDVHSTGKITVVHIRAKPKLGPWVKVGPEHHWNLH